MDLVNPVETSISALEGALSFICHLEGLPAPLERIRQQRVVELRAAINDIAMLSNKVQELLKRKRELACQPNLTELQRAEMRDIDTALAGPMVCYMTSEQQKALTDRVGNIVADLTDKGAGPRG